MISFQIRGLNNRLLATPVLMLATGVRNKKWLAVSEDGSRTFELRKLPSTYTYSQKVGKTPQRKSPRHCGKIVEKYEAWLP